MVVADVKYGLSDIGAAMKRIGAADFPFFQIYNRREVNFVIFQS